MRVPLFRLPAGARRRPAGPTARRTARQRFLIETGYHPLAPATPGRMLKLHPAAVRDVANRKDGPRCGGCAMFGPLNPIGESWEIESKRCWLNEGERVTRGNATEARAWWPGCEDWSADPLRAGRVYGKARQEGVSK
jgi:hypothetical protein